jgi:hypothetical protein
LLREQNRLAALKFGPVQYITEWVCSTPRDELMQEK